MGSARASAAKASRVMLPRMIGLPLVGSVVAAAVALSIPARNPPRSDGLIGVASTRTRTSFFPGRGMGSSISDSSTWGPSW